MDNLEYMQLDLADMNSIKSFSKKFQRLNNRLDILLNNAGLGMPFQL